MSIVYGKGINDMPRGWTSEDEWNKMVYLKWKNMLARCYSEKYHEKHPTYKDCTVCERWLLLSNFVEDFYKIDGYDKEKLLNGELCLDKDIKSNGQNKEYYIENCMLVSNTENIKQSNKTMDYSFIKTGENKYEETNRYLICIRPPHPADCGSGDADGVRPPNHRWGCHHYCREGARHRCHHHRFYGGQPGK